jgi:transcription initiation factor IIE alpha subunit
MIIYNVTINIDDSVHDDWLEWMKKKHIPDMLATEKFLEAKMCKVMIEEEMGGTTYSIQYRTQNKETLERYYQEDAEKMRNEGNQLFPNKFVAFRTELEIINEQTF